LDKAAKMEPHRGNTHTGVGWGEHQSQRIPKREANALTAGEACTYAKGIAKKGNKYGNKPPNADGRDQRSTMVLNFKPSGRKSCREGSIKQ